MSKLCFSFCLHPTFSGIFPLLLTSEELPCALDDTNASPYPLPGSLVDPYLLSFNGHHYMPPHQDPIMGPYLLSLSFVIPILLKTFQDCIGVGSVEEWETPCLICESLWVYYPAP